MRKIRLCPTLVALACGSLLAAQVPKPNFTGNWEVDKLHSTMKTTPAKNPDPEAPPAPPPPPADQAFDMTPPESIVLNGRELTITDGDSPSLKLTTDGKENVNPLPNGAVNRSKTRWDGNHLITEWSLEHNGNRVLHGTDRRSLSEGGEKLIDERTVTTPLAETHFHIVWLRKNK